MAHFKGSEKQLSNFSVSDEYLSLHLECIQAHSHFVKGALG